MHFRKRKKTFSDTAKQKKAQGEKKRSGKTKENPESQTASLLLHARPINTFLLTIPLPSSDPSTHQHHSRRSIEAPTTLSSDKTPAGTHQTSPLKILAASVKPTAAAFKPVFKPVRLPPLPVAGGFRPLSHSASAARPLYRQDPSFVARAARNDRAAPPGGR
jgi:hypothetical protein